LVVRVRGVAESGSLAAKAARDDKGGIDDVERRAERHTRMSAVGIPHR